MTVRRHRHRAILGCVLVIAGAVLAGCEKPAPGVTVWAGTSSDHREAQCWSFDPAVPVDGKLCTADETATGSVKVSPDTIGISVEPVVAEIGWIPILEGKPLVAQPLRVTYYSFALAEADLQAVKHLQIVSISADGKSARGVWNFNLTPSR